MFVGFGNSDKWQSFEKSYPIFIEKTAPLFQTFGKVFTRKVESSAPDADRVVFHLGMLCLEDFKEILLICANGYGIGGLKLLRGLYEKAVTADYLSAHPNEAGKFLDYFFVHMRKNLNHLRNIYGRDFLPKDEADYIEQGYERVKDKFQEPLCKNCGTTKPQMSWTKLDTASMAKAADSTLAGWYYDCYFLPTLEAHTTMPAILGRLKLEEEKGFSYFSNESQGAEVRKVLIRSHLIMLTILNRQNEHFKLQLDEELWERANDFDGAWPELKKDDSAD